jgi:hypothetical protein
MSSFLVAASPGNVTLHFSTIPWGWVVLVSIVVLGGLALKGTKGAAIGLVVIGLVTLIFAFFAIHP